MPRWAIIVAVVVSTGVSGCPSSGERREEDETPPVAALADDSIAFYLGEVASLDAQPSFDPGAEEEALSRGIAGFHWELTSVPSGSTAAISSSAATISFTLDVEGAYAGTVTVIDGAGLSSAPLPFSVSAIRRPSATLSVPGARPNGVVQVDVIGQATSWDSTTVAGPNDGVAFSGLSVTASTSAIVTITLGADADQAPRVVSFTTPGAGPDGVDEVAQAELWTCAGTGEAIIERESGSALQYLCDLGSFTLDGGFTSPDDGRDTFRFVASSSGEYAIVFDWYVPDVDFDILVLDSTGNSVVGDPGPFGGGNCFSVSKPEVCTAPLVAGHTYHLLVLRYEGFAGGYHADVVAP